MAADLERDFKVPSSTALFLCCLVWPVWKNYLTILCTLIML